MQYVFNKIAEMPIYGISAILFKKDKNSKQFRTLTIRLQLGMEGIDDFISHLTP